MSATSSKWPGLAWRVNSAMCIWVLSLVDQPAGDRPATELVAVGQLQLPQHGADVSLHGLHRDVEPQRDLLVEVAARDVAEYFPLAGGELVELGIDLLGGQVAGEGVEHESRQPRREDRVAVPDPPNCVCQLLAGDRLGDVAARS